MIRFSASLLAALLLILTTLVVVGRVIPAPAPEVLTTPILDALQQRSDLVVLEVKLSTIVISEIHGYSGGVRACIVAVGDAWIGTSLDDARVIDLDNEARLLTLLLPRPRVLRVSVDVDRTRLYSLDRTGAWMLLPFSTREDEVIAGAIKSAQGALQKAAEGDEHQRSAMHHAEVVVQELARKLNWTVRIRWDALPEH